MKKIKAFMAAMVMLLTTIATPAGVMVPAAHADGVDVFRTACRSGNSSDSELCRNNQPLFGRNSIWTNIINTLLFVVGAAAVLMIIIGGLRYVLSGGDQSAISSAKNTILYSVVGLIVAFMAYAIVNFVVGALR